MADTGARGRGEEPEPVTPPPPQQQAEETQAMVVEGLIIDEKDLAVAAFASAGSDSSGEQHEKCICCNKINELEKKMEEKLNYLFNFAFVLAKDIQQKDTLIGQLKEEMQELKKQE